MNKFIVTFIKTGEKEVVDADTYNILDGVVFFEREIKPVTRVNYEAELVCFFPISEVWVYKQN